MKDHYILTPYFLDQPIPGLEPLVDAGWEINDPNLPEGSPQSRMGVVYEPLSEFVRAAIQRGERPVSVAGDCCTSLGVLAGLQQAEVNPILIWFDAHGDFNTWETTPSGFLGGMPLAMLVGRGEQTIMEQLEVTPIPESRVILSDARDLDPGEQRALADSKVVHLTSVLDLLTYKLGPGPIWVHFDTDVLDASYAPGSNYPVPGGPSIEDMQRVFSYLSQSGGVVAVSLSSWNPELDKDDRTQEVCMELLAELLGHSYLE